MAAGEGKGGPARAVFGRGKVLFFFRIQRKLALPKKPSKKWKQHFVNTHSSFSNLPPSFQQIKRSLMPYASSIIQKKICLHLNCLKQSLRPYSWNNSGQGILNATLSVKHGRQAAAGLSKKKEGLTSSSLPSQQFGKHFDWASFWRWVHPENQLRTIVLPKSWTQGRYKNQKYL